MRDEVGCGNGGLWRCTISISIYRRGASGQPATCPSFRLVRLRLGSGSLCSTLRCAFFLLHFLEVARARGVGAESILGWGWGVICLYWSVLGGGRCNCT